MIYSLFYLEKLRHHTWISRARGGSWVLTSYTVDLVAPSLCSSASWVNVVQRWHVKVVKQLHACLIETLSTRLMVQRVGLPVLLCTAPPLDGCFIMPYPAYWFLKMMTREHLHHQATPFVFQNFYKSPINILRCDSNVRGQNWLWFAILEWIWAIFVTWT